MEIFTPEKKILITGGTGFLGSRIVSILQAKGFSNLVIPDSKIDDLRITENCSKITKNVDIVFHTAAKVGGIGLNQQKPGELFYDNLMMGVNLLEESRKNNVEKFISLGTICSYPKFTPLPFKEENIWDGYPEDTNAPYGLAKKMLLVQSNAYKDQYGFKSITVFPTNLYGPNDNFNDNSSHVIPALIKKIITAKKLNHDSITLWGDGTPTRDFLFVDDAAKGIILAAEKYEKTEPLNLGSGQEISIDSLAKLIMKIVNVSLKINWDIKKPNGQPRRCIDSEKAKHEIGFNPTTSLEVGINETINWYLNKN
jgi:GDP-L-fucose synthase